MSEGGVLRRRADRLRAVVSAQADEVPMLAVAEFNVGTRRFALPLMRLMAAVPLRAVTPVPLAPPHLIGIFRYQGEVVPVLSLPSLLGEVSSLSDSTTLLIVDAGGRLVGFDVERTPQSAWLPLAEVEAAQQGTPALALVGAGELRIELIDVVRLLVEGARRHGP